MSRWTHVAAIFRIDSIGEISDNEIIEKFGRTVDWEEMAEKKTKIKTELEQEINKYKTVTYYEDMAKKYPNNSRLQDLVNKLLELGE